MLRRLLLIFPTNPYPWYPVGSGGLLSDSDMCVFGNLCNSVVCEAKNLYIGVL